MPEYMTPDEVAELLRVPPRLVAIWRQKGRGPRYVKVVGLIRYERSDVEAFLAANTVTTR